MTDAPPWTLKPEPKPTLCPKCDFGTGRRGMDRCATCDGVGSIFIVNGEYFPNTERGYIEAVVHQEPRP